MEVNLLDRMLTEYQDRNVPVTIVLQNKVRISGKIRSFDSYVILLENQKNEIVYRHAVSTITQAVAAEQPKPVHRKTERPLPASRSQQKPAVSSAKQRPAQHPPRPAAQTDSSLNTGMKEGLLRWMQEQKASK